MLKYLLAYIPAKVLPGFINLLSIMIFARIFSQHEYGEFTYILAMVALIQGAIFPWVRMSLARFIHDNQEEDKKKSLLDLVYNLHYLLIIILSIVLIGLFSLLDNNYLLIMITIIFTNSIVEVIFIHLRSEFNVNKFSIFNIMRATSKLIFTFLLSLMLDNGIYTLILGLITSNIIVMIFLRKHLAAFNLKSIYKNKKLITEFLKYGLPLTVTFMMVIILSTTDRIFIKNFLGNNEVAQYSLAYDFSSFVTTNILSILSLAYSPIILRSYANNLNFKKRLLEFNKLIFISSSILLIFIVSNSSYISEIIFGNQYETSVMSKIIVVISITAFISGLKSYYVDIVFHMSKNTKLQIIPVISAALLNIILNLIFIPNLGLDGALYSTFISYIVALLLSILISRKLIRIPIFNLNSFICLILVVCLPYLLNIFFNQNNFREMIFSLIVISIIFLCYVLILERELLQRIFKGEIIDGK